MTAAYEDVRDAFDYYLQHHNQGRGFLLVGHQQGYDIVCGRHFLPPPWYAIAITCSHCSHSTRRGESTRVVSECLSDD